MTYVLMVKDKETGNLRERRMRKGSVINDHHDLYAAIMSKYAYEMNSNKEHFLVFFLNARRALLGSEIVSIGTLTSTLVHPREVFRPAIVANAKAIAVAHNHPTGEASPSPEDIRLTERLAKAGDLLGIELLDHVIVGKPKEEAKADMNICIGNLFVSTVFFHNITVPNKKEHKLPYESLRDRGDFTP